MLKRSLAVASLLAFSLVAAQADPDNPADPQTQWREWYQTVVLDKSFDAGTGRILALEFTPDGKHLLIADESASARLIDAETGEAVKVFSEGETNLRGAALSPDGKRVLTFGSDNCATIWDAGEGTKLHTLKHEDAEVTCAAWTPDSTQLITGDTEGKVRLWAAATGTQSGIEDIGKHTAWMKDKAALTGSAVTVVAVAPGGEQAYASVGGAHCSIDLPGFDSRSNGFSTGIVTAYAYSRCGHVGVRAAEHDSDGFRFISVDIEARGDTKGDGAPRVDEKINDIAFAPGDDVFAFALEDGSVKLLPVELKEREMIRKNTWRTHTIKSFHSINTGEKAATRLAFSPDGKRLVVGNGGGMVMVYTSPAEAPEALPAKEIVKEKERDRLPEGFPVPDSFFDDIDEKVKLKPAYQAWGEYAKSFKPTIELFAGAEIKDAALSPDGKWIATTGPDNKLTLWDAGNGHEVAQLDAHTDVVTVLRFSPDSSQIASGSADHSVRVWDVATGLPRLTLTGHTERVNCLAYSADGKWLASGSEDATVRSWNLETSRSTVHQATRFGRGGRDEESEEPFTAVGWSGDEVIGGTDSNSSYRWRRGRSDSHSSSWSSGSKRIVVINSTPDGNFTIRANADGSVRLSEDGFGGTSFTYRLNGTLVGLAIPLHAMHMWVASKARLHVVPLQLEKPPEDDDTRRFRMNSLEDFAVLDTSMRSIVAIGCSADGSSLLLADKSGRLEVRTTDALRPGVPAELKAELEEIWPRRRESLVGVRVSPDGKLTAGAFEDGSVKLWDAQGDVKSVLGGAGEAPREMIWSASGRKLLTWSGGTEVSIWDAATARRSQEVQLEFKPVAVAASPGLEFVAAANVDGGVIIWDAAQRRTMTTLKGFDQPVDQLFWSEDGNCIAARAGKLVRVYDAGANVGLAEYTFEAPVLLGLAGETVAVLDGKKLEVRGWNDPPVEHTHALSWTAKPDTNFAMRDGKVALAERKSAAVFNLSDGKLIATMSSGTDITCLDFDSAGRVVTGGADGQLRLWRLP